MAINIQNLVAAATAKTAVAATDSADSARLASLTDLLNNHRNTQSFATLASLPTADSSNAGMIFRVAADSAGSYIDSGAVYYVSYRDQWKAVNFTDSAVAQTAPVSYSFQGSNFGYVSGGSLPGQTNVIQKFSFSADENSTDVGDLTVARANIASQSSTTHGYSSGGFVPPYSNVIDKFPFASDGNATDVGDLTVARSAGAGQSSTASGYTSGGNNPSSTNIIDKFPFSSDGNATDVGDLTVARYALAGQSSSDNGYSSGGYTQPPSATGTSNVIDKFPFASDADATDVGNLLATTKYLSGQSSTTHGYTAGGDTAPSNYTNVIQKFSFSSDGNSTDVGDLTVASYPTAPAGSRNNVSGQSSTTHGYVCGGRNSPSTPWQDIIEKFSFASDADGTDVGNLIAPIVSTAGQQY
jgi:hypothetical protein